MKKPRAFLFDVDDWLGSFTVEEMTGDQVKAYVYLLCRAWHEKPIATLPNDDARLARMARVTPQQWAQIKPEILLQFRSDGNGRLYNERLKKEASYCRARSAAGASGWSEERREQQAARARQITKQETKQPTKQAT